MPIHDWSRVDAGIFHAFHTVWCSRLQETLNAGRLPRDYYSLVEQHAREDEDEDAARWVTDLLTLHTDDSSDGSSKLPAGHGGLALADAPPKVRHRLAREPDYRAQQRTLAVRHVSGHRLVAVVEMVSPANKDRIRKVEQFVSKIEAFLGAGVHVLLVDLFPPGTYDPRGMHGALGHWVDFSGGACPLSAEEPLTLASYRAVKTPEAFLEHVAVGQPLPDMPLFFAPGRYVNVPLEPTYNAAFSAMPQFWRDRLTAVVS